MRRTYPGLDFVRLAAALMVAFYHLGFFVVKDDPAHQTSLAPWLSWGWVGVEVFFVISGFVIAFSAEGKSVGQFAKSRLLRLYPAVWICATLSAILIPVSLADYARSVVIWPFGPWVSGVYWTLPVEMAFYLLAGIAIWRRWDFNRVAVVLGSISTAFWLFKCVRFALQWPNLELNNPIASMVLNFGAFFALGVLIFERRHLLLALLFTGTCLVEVTARSWFMGFPHFYLAPVVWMLALLCILASNRWEGQLSNWKRPARTLGLMTYPLYLIHTAIGDAIGGLWLSLIVSLALAALTLPLEKAIKELLRSKPKSIASFS